MRGWIGITLGDVTGIGPEVALKALVAGLPPDDTRYLLIGDAGHARQINQQLALNLSLQTYDGPNGAGRGGLAGRWRATLSASGTRRVGHRAGEQGSDRARRPGIRGADGVSLSD